MFCFLGSTGCDGGYKRAGGKQVGNYQASGGQGGSNKYGNKEVYGEQEPLLMVVYRIRLLINFIITIFQEGPQQITIHLMFNHQDTQ